MLLLRVLLCVLAVGLWPLAARAEEQAIEFATVAKGTNSGLQEPRYQVVADPQAWATLWALHTLGQEPAPPIDFEANVVLAAFWGTRATGGYTLTITRVVKEADGVRVELERREPESKSMKTAAITQPYHIVSVPRAALGDLVGKVRFLDVAAEDGPQPLPTPTPVAT